MRGKKHDVCHTCRQHKIGCDGLKPACGQCRLTGRECAGYLQDLVVFHHTPALGRSRPKKKKNHTEAALVQSVARLELESTITDEAVSRLGSCDLQQPSYDECVAILVQHYIPKDEIPFLSHVEPSKSRICGGWVQALPHVSQNDADFERIITPAVRALTMAMMATGTSKHQEYLGTYGDALQGIRAVLDSTNEPIGSTVAIAGMCLALSEVLVPTSNDGYKTHLRGVAAMMQSRGPCAFTDGVAHLMFVGVRPLIVLDAILRRRTTFLMDEEWRVIPFSLHHASRMQLLLGHATAIASLLEAMENDQVDPQSIRTGLSEVIRTLQGWEDSFVGEGMLYRPISPSHLDLCIEPHLLPNPCFDFVDVSHANSLTHCWAFRLVCLLYVSNLDSQLIGEQNIQSTCASASDQHASIVHLCTLICQGLPYLLQKEMSLYGSMSAGFPLHVVSETLRTLQSQDSGLLGWCTAIKEQVHSQRIALYEEMVESGAFT